jgi:two-component system, chemotaxis family, protein-glutamate methylesterase/glutaminase
MMAMGQMRCVGIKDVGGTTIAQKLETAGQPDMPETAIASGCIDFILSPEDIAQETMRIARGADSGKRETQ